MAVDDIYTKALLHMNGVDASTTFTDESGKTWTANGNAQIDTAQSKFGGASGLFDGTGDYIDTPDHDDFNVGSEDFTIDFQIKLNAFGLSPYIFGQSDSGGGGKSFYGSIWTSGEVKFGIYSGGVIEATSVGQISDSDWHHIAMVRDGDTLRIFFDGTPDGTADVTGMTVQNSPNKFALGRLGEIDGFYLNAWIDEFRFSKGIARWTTNFTPPTSEYDSIVKVIADAMGITEAVEKLVGKIKIITDSESIAEAINRIRGIPKTVSETMGIAESISRARGRMKVVSSTIGITEAVNRIRGRLKVVSDTMGITEAITRLRHRVRTIMDSIGIVEVVLKKYFIGTPLINLVSTVRTKAFTAVKKRTAFFASKFKGR